MQQMVPWLGESKQGDLSADCTVYREMKRSLCVREAAPYISRGPEFSAIKTTPFRECGEVVVVDQVPVREVETPDWLSGDFHQHTVGSLDSNMPVGTKLIENVVEGIELAVTTDHDNLTDYRPYAENWGLTDQVMTWMGMEISYTSVGHFNAFPLGIDPGNPFAMIGAQFWALKGPQTMMEDVLSLWPEALVQINHTRGTD